MFYVSIIVHFKGINNKMNIYTTALGLTQAQNLTFIKLMTKNPETMQESVKLCKTIETLKELKNKRPGKPESARYLHMPIRAIATYLKDLAIVTKIKKHRKAAKALRTKLKAQLFNYLDASKVENDSHRIAKEGIKTMSVN